MSRKKKTVGQLIKEKRIIMDCSQEAIAVELGVSIKFVSLVENGERQLPVEHIPKLANFLEIPLKQLFKAKLYDEKTHDEIKRIRKELMGGVDEVKTAIELNKIKEFRAKEIAELIKFLEIQRQDYIAQIKTGTIEKQRVEAQIQLLTEERELLGFGQLEMNI